MTEAVSSKPEGLKEVFDNHELFLEKLDNLLERYLNLLDRYQTARQQLANFFSLGYLSLAQANFNAPNHIHYGQDYYDERMQALRRVTLDAHSSHNQYAVSKHEPPSSDADVTGSNENSPMDVSSSTGASAADSPAGRPSDPVAKKAPPVDPLRWFGILVPPALRAAQSQFVQAVEGPLPDLVNITQEMRALESEVSRLRKVIKRNAPV